MTISAEYISLLETLLIDGYQSTYYYYYTTQKSAFTFNFPTGIAMIPRENGVPQAIALAKITSIVENGGELSITFDTTFTTDFNANEIDLYGVIGSTILYKIATITGSFQSSTDDNLSVEWTIEIVVNGQVYSSYTNMPVFIGITTSNGLLVIAYS